MAPPTVPLSGYGDNPSSSVRAETNLGFAEASNRGVAGARADLVVFLNNDAVAEPGFLKALGEALDDATDGQTACVAAKILNEQGTQVEFGGSGLNLFGTGFQASSWQPDFMEAKYGDALPFACGGAMLVRRDVFVDTGGFDPDFFVY